MSDHKVIVYSSPMCSSCMILKEFLTEKHIDFEEVDVMADRLKAQELVQKSGATSLPQIEIDGEIIVGFDKEKISEKLGI